MRGQGNRDQRYMSALAVRKAWSQGLVSNVEPGAIGSKSQEKELNRDQE